MLNTVLTPLTCASIVSEILKCLVYEKSLIPYHYMWLKNIVCDHRKRTDQNESVDIFAEKHIRMAVSAYDVMENINMNIKRLFKFGNNITEILILVGATPFSPKDVYKIVIPKLATGHNETNHHSMLSKIQPKILRSIFLSKEWTSNMDEMVPTTNLYVLVKTEQQQFILDRNTAEAFMISPHFFVPRSARTLTINLSYNEDVEHNCCTIYEDNPINQEAAQDVHNIDYSKNLNSEDMFELDTEWLQANYILKGFI